MNNNPVPSNVPHYTIYQEHCAVYDRLRTCMDHEGNLLRQFLTIQDPSDQIVVEFAAGTGRLTGLIAPLAKAVHAFDLAPDMVNYAREKFSAYPNVTFNVAGNDSIPLPGGSADIVVEGWSLGYIAFAGGAAWKSDIDHVLSEMERLLRPGGSILLFGTLGTGTHRPAAPNKVLAQLYEYLTTEKGFTQSEWFPTDYRFTDLEEAVELTSFFWNDKFGNYVREHQLVIVPECTAIWHKTLPLS
ncbi:class I SAM-dependent methyltransferase [Mucilaginibacter sp. RS28]|uniref:Class I SAM-dependent methyltransferase n=1 Tax=Mucilaginibacter straminoryzae TaxID=2932774 RepID=A0A9X1X5I6_9SPHI|nr:class I SAM-dependent methyltransferase [Mucilaginibacter straminoryzae]MCJ8211328.1 class I SAM-dependent methyltransferase [Mucilaginibacter straminoryzae]